MKIVAEQVNPPDVPTTIFAATATELAPAFEKNRLRILLAEDNLTNQKVALATATASSSTGIVVSSGRL